MVSIGCDFNIEIKDVAITLDRNSTKFKEFLRSNEVAGELYFIADQVTQEALNLVPETSDLSTESYYKYQDWEKADAKYRRYKSIDKAHKQYRTRVRKAKESLRDAKAAVAANSDTASRVLAKQLLYPEKSRTADLIYKTQLQIFKNKNKILMDNVQLAEANLKKAKRWAGANKGIVNPSNKLSRRRVALYRVARDRLTKGLTGKEEFDSLYDGFQLRSEMNIKRAKLKKYFYEDELAHSLVYFATIDKNRVEGHATLPIGHIWSDDLGAAVENKYHCLRTAISIVTARNLGFEAIGGSG